MPVIRISNFEGRIPLVSSKLLGEHQAQTAENCTLRRGMIQPLKDMEEDSEIAGLQVVDSNGDDVDDSEDSKVTVGQSRSMYLMNESWLQWEPAGVDIVKSFIPDSDYRIYYTGDGAPKQTDHTLAISGDAYTWPAAYYLLGVPAPTTALTAAEASGGTHTAKTVCYVYTYVTEWGEESAPSPPSNVLDVSEDYYVELSGFVEPTASYLNVTHVRLYRVNTGTALAEYQLVPFPVDNISAYADDVDYVEDDRVTYEGSTYICIQANGPGSDVKDPTETDYWTLDVDDQEVADAETNGCDDKREDSELGEVITTEDWDIPPSDMEGLHLFVNNILAGFSGNEVYLSEPAYPYAWPARYALQCSYDVVGIGHYTETLVVLTEGNPYIGIGTDPASMTLKDLPDKRPCESKMGIVSTARGVIYPSDDGLRIINAAGNTLFTKGLFTKEQWQAKSLSDIISAFWNDTLYVFIKGTGTGFYIDMDDIKVIDFSISDKKFYDVAIYGEYMYVLIEDQLTNMYVIYKWEEASTELTYTWKSKEFLYYSPFTFTVGTVTADGTVTFNLYVDDVLKHTETATDDNIFRMPGGYSGKKVELEVTGTSDVDMITIATSIDELIQSLEE